MSKGGQKIMKTNMEGMTLKSEVRKEMNSGSSSSEIHSPRQKNLLCHICVWCNPKARRLFC